MDGQSISARGDQVEALREMAVRYEISCLSKSGKTPIVRRKLYKL